MASDSAAANGGNRAAITVCVILATLMQALDTTIANVALPYMQGSVSASQDEIDWVLTSYIVAAAIMTPPTGFLASRFGIKRLFLVSVAGFTIVSMLCGAAQSLTEIVLFRVLQGAFGAALVPLSQTVLLGAYPRERQGFAMALFGMGVMVGPVLGPVLGGWLTEYYSWRYVFYINLPIGMGLIVLIMVLLKASKVLSRPHIDLVGASYFSGAILFLMFGLNLVGESFAGLSLLSAGALLFLSLSFALLFLRQEKKESKPILDTVLLKSKPFLAANLLNIIMGAGFFGLFATVPLYATSVHKLSTLMSGMILTPRSLGVICASVITSFLLKQWGYRRPLMLGLGIVSCATILLAPGLPLVRIMEIRWGIAETLAFLILFCGIGAGIANPAANNACIELMPEKVATIVGLRGMFRTVGGALGISLITFILHLSADPGTGFNIIFISFGLALSSVIPLVFLMPTGQKAWG